MAMLDGILIKLWLDVTSEGNRYNNVTSHVSGREHNGARLDDYNDRKLNQHNPQCRHIKLNQHNPQCRHIKLNQHNPQCPHIKLNQHNPQCPHIKLNQHNPQCRHIWQNEEHQLLRNSRDFRKFNSGDSCKYEKTCSRTVPEASRKKKSLNIPKE
jgi:hypothetical protein